MSDVSRNSIFSAALDALQNLLARGTAADSAPTIDGVQHRVAVLRVREGRIIEQSARLNGC